MSFLKRFILSKEPIVLKLESCDNRASIYLKNKYDDGLIRINADNKKFTIDNHEKQILEVYYDIIKQYSVLNTDLIHAKKIMSPQLILQEYNHPTDGVSYKGIINHLSGIHYILPSQMHSHRFIARTVGNVYTEWMRIQGKNNGESQVGIGTTIIRPDVSLQVNGKIYCDSIITKNPLYSHSASNTGSSYLLDENLKIHAQYLPEVYKTSLIQNDVGVGIGTKLPLQKLHVEGGCYLRDRLGIGNTSPTAILDIVQTTSDITGVRLQQTDGIVFEAWNKDKPLFVLSSSGCVGIGTQYEDDSTCKIAGLITTDNIRTKNISIEDSDKRCMVYVDESKFISHIPAIFENEVECKTILSKEPLAINSPSVIISDMYANENYLRIPNANEYQTVESLDVDLILNELLPKIRPSLLNGKKVSITNNLDQEVIDSLTESGNYLRKDDLLYILVATVNDLHQRVKDLELQKY